MFSFWTKLGDVAAATHVSWKPPSPWTAGGQVPAFVAGMVAGADSIDDLDVIRHGGMARLFGGMDAPSTLCSFPRAFTMDTRASRRR